MRDALDTTPVTDRRVGSRYTSSDVNVGPAERRSKTHELVIVVPGRVGYLPPGDRLDIAPGETAYVATA